MASTRRLLNDRRKGSPPFTERRKGQRRAAQDAIPVPPSPPPNPTYDMLSLMVMDPALNSHLEGSKNPMYTAVDTALQRIYHIKGKAGYPWDVIKYDDQIISMWITEEGWTDPHSYKRTKNMVSAHQTTIPFSKRQAQVGDVLIATDSTIQHVVGCVGGATFNLGAVRCEVHGPFNENLSGDLMTIQTIQVWYIWSNGQVRETFSFSIDPSRKYGFVRWSTSNWVNGAWAQQSETVFNKLVAGRIAPVFPCTES